MAMAWRHKLIDNYTGQEVRGYDAIRINFQFKHRDKVGVRTAVVMGEGDNATLVQAEI